MPRMTRRSRPARRVHPRSGRAVRRRRRGAAGRRGDLPARAATCSTSMITVDTDEICAAIKDIFEDTRAIAEPAGALALAGLKCHAERAAPAGRTDRHQLRRQHEFRPAAASSPSGPRSASAARRCSRSPFRKEAGQLPPLHPPARPPRRHRVQLSLRRGRAGADLRRHRACARRRREEPDHRHACAEGYAMLDMSDNETGEAACPLHGRRPRRPPARRADLPLPVPGAARRAAEVPEGLRADWNISPVPLPQPRRRLRPRSLPASRSRRRTAPGSCASSTNSAILTGRDRTTRPTACSSTAMAAECRAAAVMVILSACPPEGRN